MTSTEKEIFRGAVIMLALIVVMILVFGWKVVLITFAVVVSWFFIWAAQRKFFPKPYVEPEPKPDCDNCTSSQGCPYASTHPNCPKYD